MRATLNRLFRSNLWLSVGAVVLGLGLFYWANFWKKHVFQDTRKVISMAQVTLPNADEHLQLVKVQENALLAVEVFKISKAGTQLVQRIELRGQKDAYFRYQGQNSNLITQELTESGDLLLIAPTMDQDLVAHLNAFRLKKNQSLFLPLEPGFNLFSQNQ